MAVACVRADGGAGGCGGVGDGGGGGVRAGNVGWDG